MALYDFDPTKIDWPFNRQKPLALSTGQVVEIVHDDGSEWALGHLTGVPETLGYFPKNYTVSVGEYQAGLDADPHIVIQLPQNPDQGFQMISGVPKCQ